MRDPAPTHPLLVQVGRTTWGRSGAWTELLAAPPSSGYFPSEQGQTYSGHGISQRGKLPFGPASWETGQGPQLGQKRASGLPTNQSADSTTASALAGCTLETLDRYRALQMLLSK